MSFAPLIVPKNLVKVARCRIVLVYPADTLVHLKGSLRQELFQELLEYLNFLLFGQDVGRDIMLGPGSHNNNMIG